MESEPSTVPLWKRSIACGWANILQRSVLSRRLVDVSYRLAHPTSAFERHYWGQRQAILDQVTSTDIDDADKINFNLRYRELRHGCPRRPLTWAWVLPDITGAGSGGQRTVFRLARHLLEQGHHVKIYINGRSFRSSTDELRESIRVHYGAPDGMGLFLTTDVIEPSDILFATGWETAYTVFNASNTLFKAYLVQDYEPVFTPRGAESLFAENTYKMNFFPLCSSPWLQALTAAPFGLESGLFTYGFDPDCYRRLPGMSRNPDQVAVYIRPTTARRGTELVCAALARLKKMRPQTHVVTFGHPDPLAKMDWVDEQSGQLDDSGLARLYNESTLVLVLSLTNVSIIPIEAMACGALPMDIDLPSPRSAFTSGKGIALVPPHAVALANSLRHYLDDEADRNAVMAKADAVLSAHHWPAILRQMEEDVLSAYYGCP